MTITLTLGVWMLVPAVLFAICIYAGIDMAEQEGPSILIPTTTAGLLLVGICCLVRYLP